MANSRRIELNLIAFAGNLTKLSIGILTAIYWLLIKPQNRFIDAFIMKLEKAVAPAAELAKTTIASPTLSMT